MNIRKIVFDLVGCKYAGLVTEVAAEGLFVKYDNHSSETLLAAFDTSSAKLVVADSVSFIQEQAQF